MKTLIVSANAIIARMICPVSQVWVVLVQGSKSHHVGLPPLRSVALVGETDAGLQRQCPSEKSTQG